MIAVGNIIQETVVGVLSAALTVPVASVPLAAVRYVRVDAFTIVPDGLYKVEEAATHRFTVHAFDSPPGGAQSNKWVRDTLALAHDALKDIRLIGSSSRFELEDNQIVFDPAPGEVLSAHGFSRYRVQVGG